MKEAYVLVSISGNNESNIILVIQMLLPGYEDIYIKSSASAAPASMKAIGEKVLEVLSYSVF